MIVAWKLESGKECKTRILSWEESTRWVLLFSSRRTVYAVTYLTQKL